MTPSKAPSKGKQKRTYVLSAEVVERLEAQVPAGKRGAFVDRAIQNWMEERESEQLRARVLEGLRDSENEAIYQEAERLGSAAADESWRAIDDDLWEWDDAPVVSHQVAHEAAA